MKPVKKAVITAGICLAVLFGGAPQAWAADLAAAQTAQQNQRITGVVKDSTGEPLIGANVQIKGTTQGVNTDIDGRFIMEVPVGSTLVVSYVGYTTQDVKVTSATSYDIVLQENSNVLDDVVVVGYGTQKKKLVTGATVQVSGENIERMSTVQVLGALQSQTPGVTIQAVGGQPGDGFKVAIRGAGTNGNTTPLYVIDGVSGGSIDNLNPADIESIDVLKDAASCAIYGSAAANGVILITTKQGKEGKIQVTYDGNIGWQNIYKMPSLLNAQQYMQVQNWARFNSGTTLYDWADYVDADLLAAYENGTNKGTNWLELNRKKNAVVTNHSLSISSGTDRTKFSTGLGYQYQDGTFGNIVKSDFRRFTIRMNSETVIYRNDDGLDVVKVGENLYYQHRENQGLRQGDQYWNSLSTMIRANPLIPCYNSDGSYFGSEDLVNSGRLGWLSFNQYSTNPIYSMINSSAAMNKSKSHSLNVSGWLEIQPIKGLIYRGLVNYSQSSWTYRTYDAKYYLNSNDQNATDSANQQGGVGWGWSTTNTVNYSFSLGENNFNVLAGMEYGESKPNFGMSWSGTATNSVFGTFEQAYLSYMKDITQKATVTGTPYDDTRGVSYFGRVNYDFNETYMFTGILRADGSSLFAPGHRWGYFPSVSAGWIISNEKFMEPVHDIMDYLKFRIGWGQNGNKNISAFQYQAAFAYDSYSNYSFDNNKDSYTNGASPTRLSNDKLTWETSEQLNVGIDARFLNGRLNLNADYYVKTTKDLLVTVPIPSTTGFSEQLQNAGTVQNKGLEVALNWNDKITEDLSYNIGWNIAWNKNKVTKVNSDRKYNNGPENVLSQGTTYIARFEEGQPIGYFYGYKTDGVMQNEADVQAYLAQNCGGSAINSLQGESIAPGDLKFVDVNGDGVINDDDKTYLGDPNPDVTMGINIGINYKGFDLNITGYAALGHQNARSYRKFGDGQQENYTTEVYSYWNGEGTSNKYPIFKNMASGANWMSISDIYIENASYFRMQNITLGYDFNRIWKKSPFSQLRLYASAQNVFTITSYKGMDPENGRALNSDYPWMTGVDVGNYPTPRTYLVGVNIQF